MHIFFSEHESREVVVDIAHSPTLHRRRSNARSSPDTPSLSTGPTTNVDPMLVEVL